MEKKTSSANRLALKRILSQEGNNRCADCKTATHPRWASWNIGILICIRCSGIHRSLGTHISKVRSIDLDTWNDVQLEKLLEYGNKKANMYWEAQLPQNYVPDESKIMNFIKTKYELKRWIPKENASPTVKAATSSAEPPALPHKIRSSNIDLLDLDGVFSVKSHTAPQSSAKVPLSPPVHTKSKPLQSHAQPQIKSRSESIVPQKSQTQQPQTLNQVSSKPSTTSQINRTDIKKSILSLYSQPSKPAATSISAASCMTPQYHPADQPSQPVQSVKSLQHMQPSSQAGQVVQPARESHSQFSLHAQPQSIFVEDDDFANVWK